MKVRIKRRRPVEEEQASLFQYKAGSPGLGSNPIAAATSLCLHVGVVILTLYSTFPYSDPIRYQVTTIHADSTELLWYFPQGRLPQVSSDQQLRAGIPKVRLKRPGQVMTADALQSHPGKQLIWQPPPQISSNQEVPSPNLFAFSAHPRRPEVRKEFIPPKLPNPVMTTPILPEATPLTPLSPTSFLPAMISGPVKQPLRDFVAPPVKSGIAPPTTILEAPPDLGSQVQTPQLAVVVVGLDPAMNGDIHLPEGVRDPQFSAGPDNGHGGHEPAPVVVPGLNVRGTGLPSPQVAAPAHKTLLPHHQPSTQGMAQSCPRQRFAPYGKIHGVGAAATRRSCACARTRGAFPKPARLHDRLRSRAPWLPRVGDLVCGTESSCGAIRNHYAACPLESRRRRDRVRVSAGSV